MYCQAYCQIIFKLLKTKCVKNNQFITGCFDETQNLAKKLAVHLKEKDILGLRGNLGSGKTTFVQGLAQGLNVLSGYFVSSPTFTLINEYEYEYGYLYHMDFYRLNHEEEAYSLGLENYFNHGICVIEWFEKGASYVPKDFLEIEFSWISENKRQITLLSHGLRSQNILNTF